MTKEAKTQHINEQISALEDSIWKNDSTAKALSRAGLKERSEQVAKLSAENQLLIDAFREQLKEIEKE